MENDVLQARLRALEGAPKPERDHTRVIATLAVVGAILVSGIGIWAHQAYVSARAFETDLSRAVIAAATARGIEPLVLWDDVSDRLGQRLDARRPNLGLSADDALRAYGIVFEGVYPLPKIEY